MRMFNHAQHCLGDKHCKKCGRQICYNCVTPEGECLICLGWKDIILLPLNIREDVKKGGETE